jgi:hypothetical protein
VHASQWERFEGLSVELRSRVGLKRHTLGCGDVLVIPPGTAALYLRAARRLECAAGWPNCSPL